jgi:O-acetylhomoserine/O-acetylserine sulfhydrylase-like pyridoxal-dependent enzyme
MKVLAVLTADTLTATSTTVGRGRGRKSVSATFAYAHRAANLGAVGTIVGPPATTSHVELTAVQRARLGIPEGLVRYSAEIEDITDLLADLTQALE